MPDPIKFILIQIGCTKNSNHSEFLTPTLVLFIGWGGQGLEIKQISTF